MISIAFGQFHFFGQAYALLMEFLSLACFTLTNVYLSNLQYLDKSCGAVVIGTRKFLPYLAFTMQIFNSLLNIDFKASYIAVEIKSRLSKVSLGLAIGCGILLSGLFSEH